MVILGSESCYFELKTAVKLLKIHVFSTFFLHKIAQKGPQMHVETSSIHQYGEIWINSMILYLSTFEISQSHIISYLPITFRITIIDRSADSTDSRYFGQKKGRNVFFWFRHLKILKFSA